MLQAQMAFVRQKLDWSSAGSEIVEAQKESPAQADKSEDRSLLDLSRRLSHSKTKHSTPSQKLVQASELQAELGELKEEYEYLDLQKCALEASLEEQSETVKALETDNAELKEANNDLTENVEILTKDNVALTMSLKRRAEQAEELQERVDSLEGHVESLIHRVEDKENIIQELKDQIETLQEAIKIHGATPGMEAEVTLLAQSLVKCMVLMSRAEAAACAPKMLTRDDAAWQPDADIRDCNGCKKKFGGFFRRHHCRVCGDVYCNSCASRERMTFEDGRKERCCVSCFKEFIHSQKNLRRLNKNAAEKLTALEGLMKIDADKEWRKFNVHARSRKASISNKENSTLNRHPISFADVVKQGNKSPVEQEQPQQQKRSPLAPRSPCN